MINKLLLLILSVPLFGHAMEQPLNKQLFEAVYDGDVDRLGMLLSGNPSLAKTTGSLGNTLLHRAVYLRNNPAVELLLEKGAFVNAINNSGNTPLHTALFFQNNPAVELLLENGADPLMESGLNLLDPFIESSLRTNVLEKSKANPVLLEKILNKRDGYFFKQFKKFWPSVRLIWVSTYKPQADDCYLGKLPSEVLCMISDYVWGNKKVEYKKWKEGSAKYRKQLKESEAIES